MLNTHWISFGRGRHRIQYEPALYAPYHVVMEDDNGELIHSYLAEAQITYEMDEDSPLITSLWMSWLSPSATSYSLPVAQLTY